MSAAARSHEPTAARMRPTTGSAICGYLFDVARVSLRLPESVKARVEEAAAASGQSVNAWLVRAVTQTLDAPSDRASRPTRESRVIGQRLSGWQR